MSGAVEPTTAVPPAANDDAPEPRYFDVKPEEVLQAIPERPWPWRETSFFAPILLTLGISAAFLYGMIALGVLLWRLRG